MKLCIAVFNFLLMVYGSLNGMADHTIEKISAERATIDSTKFAPLLAIRTIRSLTRLCIPSLSVYVCQQIEHNPQFNIAQFNSLLTLIGENSLYLQQSLAQEIDTVPLEEHFREKINTHIEEVKLAGSKIILSKKKSFWNNKKVKKIINKKKSEVVTNIYDDHVVNNKNCFAISPNGMAAKIEKKYLFLQHPDLYKLITIDFIKELSRYTLDNYFSCMAFSPTQECCFIGTTHGEIFCINFNKFPSLSTKVEKLSEHQITILYCGSNGCVYAADNNTNNFALYNSTVFELPFKQETTDIIGSADNNIVVFQDHNNKKVSLINWNTLSIVTRELGKIVAITPNYHIMASQNDELLIYSIQGKLLHTMQLPTNSKIYGNTHPSSDPTEPLYVVSTKEDTIIHVNDYADSYDYDLWVPSMRSVSCIRRKVGCHTENGFKSCLLFPKQLPVQELFDELAKRRK